MGKPATNRSAQPRLSAAKDLLPLIRDHLDAARARWPLATVLELVPIVEDGLFGYELVPDREAHTYLILGRNGQGIPVLRTTTYGVGAPVSLHLLAVDGRLLSRSERAARNGIKSRDYPFPDWTAAAESACMQLRALFPGRSGGARTLSEKLCGLEEALAIAHSHLARWDPYIQFFGLPNEAQLGFALAGPQGEHGALTLYQPDVWTLRWIAAATAVDETWSALVTEVDADYGKVRGHLDFRDRRTHPRRATDRGGFAVPWAGSERRQTHRRAHGGSGRFAPA